MKRGRCLIGRANWLILLAAVLSSGPTLGPTKISPRLRRRRCVASKTRSWRTVEAGRYRRGRVSWRADEKDAARSSALDGGLPSAPARRRSKPEVAAGHLLGLLFIQEAEHGGRDVLQRSARAQH